MESRFHKPVPRSTLAPLALAGAALAAALLLGLPPIAALLLATAWGMFAAGTAAVRGGSVAAPGMLVGPRWAVSAVIAVAGTALVFDATVGRPLVGVLLGLALGAVAFVVLPRLAPPR